MLRVGLAGRAPIVAFVTCDWSFGGTQGRPAGFLAASEEPSAAAERERAERLGVGVGVGPHRTIG